MSVALALTGVGLEVRGMGRRGWRRERKNFEFLRNHVESVKCIVSLEVNFGKVKCAEGVVVVLDGGGVFG